MILQYILPNENEKVAKHIFPKSYFLSLKYSGMSNGLDNKKVDSFSI